MKTATWFLAAVTGAFLASASLAADTTNAIAKTVSTNAALPKLVDLGAGKCIPCKAMAPILEDLKKTYEGQLIVEFVDVWKNPDAAEPYKINLIPTQIFYSADGRELFRHEGFFGKDDILTKWKEIGVKLEAKAATKP